MQVEVRRDGRRIWELATAELIAKPQERVPLTIEQVLILRLRESAKRTWRHQIER